MQSKAREVNVRSDIKYITLNFLGAGKFLELRHTPLASPVPEKDEREQQPNVEMIQLWQNAQNVSGEYFDVAMRNNKYMLNGILYNKTMRPMKHNPKQQQAYYQLKLFYNNFADQSAESPFRQEFSPEQLNEVKAIMRLNFGFCHARYFSGPIANVQVAMMQPSTQSVLRQLTVREGILKNVLAKDLTAEEISQDVGQRFVSRMLGKA